MKSTTRRTCNAFTKSNAKRTGKPWYAIGARGGCPALAEVGHLLINWEIGQVGE